VVLFSIILTHPPKPAMCVAQCEKFKKHPTTEYDDCERQDVVGEELCDHQILPQKNPHRKVQASRAG
jgi:hypothetical protein